MVRTYWLVQVFNEASWNLGLQPDRTDDQVESNSAPCYVRQMVAASGLPLTVLMTLLAVAALARLGAVVALPLALALRLDPGPGPGLRPPHGA
jgi:hypothetical protein